MMYDGHRGTVVDWKRGKVREAGEAARPAAADDEAARPTRFLSLNDHRTTSRVSDPPQSLPNLVWC